MADAFIDFFVNGLAGLFGSPLFLALFFILALVAWTVFSGTPGLITIMFIGTILLWLALPEIGPMNTYVGGLGLLPRDVSILVFVIMSAIALFAFIKLVRRSN